MKWEITLLLRTSVKHIGCSDVSKGILCEPTPTKRENCYPNILALAGYMYSFNHWGLAVWVAWILYRKRQKVQPNLMIKFLNEFYFILNIYINTRDTIFAWQMNTYFTLHCYCIAFRACSSSSASNLYHSSAALNKMTAAESVLKPARVSQHRISTTKRTMAFVVVLWRRRWPVFIQYSPETRCNVVARYIRCGTAEGK